MVNSDVFIGLDETFPRTCADQLQQGMEQGFSALLSWNYANFLHKQRGVNGERERERDVLSPSNR